MADEPALVAERVVKRFGQVNALDGVDLQVPHGSVLGLLGPNGAGKTTMVRILATLLPADAGRVRVAGFDVADQAAEVRQMIGDLTARGTTVLLTTQYLEEADRLADAIVVLDHGTVIAQGTAEQLKAQVGGDRLELHAPPGRNLDLLAQAVHGLGCGSPTVDAVMGRVVLPVADGAAILPDVASRLAETGLRVSDLALRRPSLDDVFLTLTGQNSDTTAAAATGGGKR